MNKFIIASFIIFLLIPTTSQASKENFNAIEYVDEIVTIMKDNAVTRNDVNWDEVELEVKKTVEFSKTSRRYIPCNK